MPASKSHRIADLVSRILSERDRLSALSAPPSAELTALCQELAQVMEVDLRRLVLTLLRWLRETYKIQEEFAEMAALVQGEFFLLLLEVQPLDHVHNQIGFLWQATCWRTKEHVMEGRGFTRNRSRLGERARGYHKPDETPIDELMAHADDHDLAREAITRYTYEQYAALLRQMAHEHLSPLDHYLFTNRFASFPRVPFAALVPGAQAFGRYTEETLRQRIGWIKKTLRRELKQRGFDDPFQDDLTDL